jgi:hypothetical protein
VTARAVQLVAALQFAAMAAAAAAEVEGGNAYVAAWQGTLAISAAAKAEIGG